MVIRRYLLTQREGEVTSTAVGNAPRPADFLSTTRRQWLAGAAGAAIGGAGAVALRPSPAVAQSSTQYVDLSSDQTIGGVKTFSSAPVVPAGAFPQGAVAGLVAALESKQEVIAPGTYLGPGAAVTGASIGAVVGSAKVTGDTFNRWEFDAGGRMFTGAGTAAPVVTLSVSGQSVSVGRLALGQNLTADAVAVGMQALMKNTTGVQNTAVGRDALLENTTGQQNTAVGFSALVRATGTKNTAVGANALAEASGTHNVAIGVSTLQKLTTGNQNTAVGVQALQLLSTGEFNTAVGQSALRAATTASFCTAVGMDALGATTTAFDCTAVGEAALPSNTTGYGNTGVGHAVLRNNKTGNGNCAMGPFTLESALADGNTALGYAALQHATIGALHVAIGFRAGSMPGEDLTRATTTADRQTLVGSYTGQASSTSRNDIVCVGYSALADADGGIALGSEARALHANSVALGTKIATTSPDQLMVGPKDIEITDAARGVVLRSPNGTRYRITVANGGKLLAVAL